MTHPNNLAGERFLRNLFDKMEMKYRVEREERRNQLRKKHNAPVFFVHELLECRMKQKMEKQLPEIESAELYSPRFIVGWLAEEGVKNILRVQEQQHQWERKIKVSDGREVVIAGSIDLRDPETGRIIEVKYLTSLYGTPHEHHTLQLGMYLWGVGEESGELWEISPRGFIPRKVEPLTDSQVRDLVEEFLSNPKIPRWPEWECELCRFENFCGYSIARWRKRGRKESES